MSNLCLSSSQGFHKLQGVTPNNNFSLGLEEITPNNNYSAFRWTDCKTITLTFPESLLMPREKKIKGIIFKQCDQKIMKKNCMLT